MRLTLWFFFHRIYAVLKVIYLAGKLVTKLKSEIAYLEVRAVTKKQLEELEDKEGREATREDLEAIPTEKME